ncbi:hypothetical protein FQN51_003412 [Onygenales sp. PD_10]|nr:hypothetical protein FQN51_003412 [Onygenales sp. PD_10]
MGRKRKRPATEASLANSKLSNSSPASHHPVLSLYYPRVVQLRSYLQDQLPSTSKSRRKRIASIGLAHSKLPSSSAQQHAAGLHSTHEETQLLADVLDSTFVGILKEPDGAVGGARQREFAAFTQSQARSTLDCTDIGATTSQSDIVDFAILTLFNRHRGSFYRPPHLICHGFQRATDRYLPHHAYAPMAGIRGIVPQYPNKNVSILKNPPWTHVLDLLGKNCEEIMLHMLLDCGLFVQVDGKADCLYQLSGTQLSELKLLNPSGNPNPISAAPRPSGDVLRTPSNINFVRSRMLYAKAALNARGGVRFGLRHIHVLNRYPDSTDGEHTVHIMKYIFPRQFGLHNVFTSSVNPKETVQPFKDYTLREEEITRAKSLRSANSLETCSHTPEKVPKRLRGELVALIQKLQKRHRLCSYAELLRHYCPTEQTNPQTFRSDSPPSSCISSAQLVSQPFQKPDVSVPMSLVTQPLSQTQPTGSSHTRSTKPSTAANANGQVRKISMTEHATPIAAVSAFCRAVLLKLIPNELFGHGEGGISNRDTVMRYVDSFVRLRRFESLSLHEVAQGLKITCVKWLEPPSNDVTPSTSSAKLSSSDIRKRTEIFLEFIYYIFDSLLIPLTRSNFYVTESGVHRNRLFYFRHDVWRTLAEPSIAQLKLSTFEEVNKQAAERILSSRNLGYSLLRLLPKSFGARPIVNLRRRQVRKCGWGDVNQLGPSINSLMTPVFNVLNYEKSQRLNTLGSTMFSVGDMYQRLKAFKERKMPNDAARGKPFYFVKLDIQACFDTIPQQRLIQLARRLVVDEEYRVTKHIEIGPPEGPSNNPARPRRKFISKAASLADLTSLYDKVTKNEGGKRKHTVFVDTPLSKRYQRKEILDLLQDHVRNNLVKIGKKYFRQRTGIPQGSVVSTLLCNFFYSEHERESLGFLDNDDVLLLRLIDDYLLITTEPHLAMQFLQVMLNGNQEYGVSVNADKSLVNFTATVNGCIIPRLLEPSQRQFPYCGNLIDTYTLSVTKDRTPKDKTLTTSDTLTVEANKAPGQSFYRKAITAFRIQMHAMFLDTKHNHVSVVLASIYENFLESAMKMYEYTRSLCQRRRGNDVSALLVRAISGLIDLAIHFIEARKRSACRTGFECSVAKAQIRWLAAAAFKKVLGRKQTKFAAALRWLDGMSRASRPATDWEAVRLRNAVK